MSGSTAPRDRRRRGVQPPEWARFMERIGRSDGGVDGPVLHDAMDRLPGRIRAALQRS